MTMRMSSAPRFGCPPWEISEAKHIVDVGCVRFNVSHVIVDVVATVDDRCGGCGRFGSSRCGETTGRASFVCSALFS